jgi:hypothetical protein
VICPACDRELTRWTSPVLEVDACDGGALRFITPRYYMPGKQEGGAF